MNRLVIDVTVKGAMTPDHILSLRETLQAKIDKYLLSLPVLTPNLPREVCELREVQL